ncbi:MAG: hypothetical protein QM759_11480 [Terricaulis sp.]
MADVTPTEAPWEFVPRNRERRANYREGFGVPELFSANGAPAPGIVTTQDDFAVSWTRDDVGKKIEVLLRTSDEAEARNAFKLCTQDQWSYQEAKIALSLAEWRNLIEPIAYRPLDFRFTVYDSHVAVHLRDRVMRHVRRRNNVAMSLTKKIDEVRPFTDVFAFDQLIQHHSLSLKEVNYLFPLYLYPDSTELDQTRRVNFDPKLYAKLRALAAHAKRGEPDEVAVFDYIYGVLHCPAYRETYAEFLKIDFPRIPWPSSPAVFWDVSDKGGQLRRLHLMEPAAIGDTPYPFAGAGEGIVEKPVFRDGAVWINAAQRFENAPEISWGFHIGGYQPAQKWLKDRKGRALDYADVQHYQRILKILSETDRIMKMIDMPL